MLKNKVCLSEPCCRQKGEQQVAGKKRKDKKGRVLRSGESQRKNLTYEYRFTDAFGKRRSVYAGTLKELREKEEQIEISIAANMDFSAGNCTVLELVERYVELKQGVRYNTKIGYNFVMNILKKDAFGMRRIRDIRTSDAQLWFTRLQREGKGYSTITSIRGVLKPAFQMAYNEDLLMKNPFMFKLSDVIVNDSTHREAMTPEEQDIWMNFIKEDRTYSRYYDEFVVLLGTGMRVSEFCGLTIDDLDFKGRKIRVDHQLVRERGGRYYIERTKTRSGIRFIPMTDEVYNSLQRIIASRPQMDIEPEVDGCRGFLLIDKKNQPKVALHIENEMRWARKKFQKLHPDIELPNITPHVFRHTFCTNLANAGMDIKNLQYLMGHSDVGVTLNVYSHSSYDHAADQLQKLAPIVRFHIPENTSEFTPDLTPNLTPIFTKTWRKMA